LERVLEIVTRHPATARHISAKLCRRFIADEPPPSAVDAVAAAFTRTSGDIRMVLQTLFATEEFRHGAAENAEQEKNLSAQVLECWGAAVLESSADVQRC
jgi:uncharacterized protein (DUF1800 family)